MREKLERLAAKLNAMRDAVLENYIEKLNSFTPQAGNPEAADAAGVLHDLDRHITNCELEIKRIEMSERMPQEVSRG